MNERKGKNVINEMAFGQQIRTNKQCLGANGGCILRRNRIKKNFFGRSNKYFLQ
jgi:hypothetical protein